MRDTIDMAREAGAMFDLGEPHPDMMLVLKAFEALVRADERNRTWTQEHWTEYERSIAAAEREACAKVCEDIYNDPKGNDGYDCYYTRPYLECADAIRARGNT
jgi:hypothetical protein